MASAAGALKPEVSHTSQLGERERESCDNIFVLPLQILPPSAQFHYFQAHERKQFVCSAQWTGAFDVSSLELGSCSLANSQLFWGGTQEGEWER